MSQDHTGSGRIVFGLFLLLVFSLGFMKPSIGSAFASLTLTDVIFPIVFVCWILAIAGGAYRFGWRIEFLAFAFYFVALLISSILSVNPRLSFVRLAGTGYLILLAVMASTVVTTADRLRLSVLAWLAGAIVPLIAAFVGIILFYIVPESSLLPDLTYHYGAVPVGDFPRISSTFVSASMFCNYLTVTLIFGLLAAKMRWIGKGPAASITIAIGVAAIFTVSIALGGMALAIGLWLWTTSSNKTVGSTSLIFAAAVAIAFLMIAPVSLSLQPGVIPSSRFLVWSDALKTFIDAPLTGKGLGTGIANVTFQNSDGTWSLLTDAHNTFLSVAAQSGIIGLVGILGIVIVTIRAGFSKRAASDAEYVPRAFAIAFLAAFVYDGLTGSFEEARHLWILIGLILAARTIATQDEGLGSLNSA